MPRRSPGLVNALLFVPWWVSAGLGVLSFILCRVLISSLDRLGPIGKGIAQGADWLPYVALVVFGFIALGSAYVGHRRKELIEGQSSIESIRSLSWSAFEFLVAEAYRRKGFTVEQSMEGGPDGGVDLVLHKDGATTLVQCKQWRSSSVGASVIRELYGVQMHEKAEQSIVITSGHFSREAEAFAVGKPMHLVDGRELLEMVRQVQSEPRAIEPVTAQTPACPKCGAPMVQRVARRGPNAGGAFLGCSTYPKCSGTRSIAS